MSRATAGTSGVNLMPLLDVLLCTMGTLIVILGVINRQARFHPTKRVAGKAAAAQQQMAEAREDLQLRIQELTTAKEKTLADLTSSRTRLAGIEDSSRELEDKLQSLVTAGKQLPAANASDDSQRGQLRSELAQLQQQRMQLEKDLQTARSNVANCQTGYAVVPFDSLYKTNRRPIYIECRANEIILQPEGIVFTRADFLGPEGPSNPVASALRAAEEYWRAAPRPAPDLPNDPYLLILVRPDGIAAFNLVQNAVASWDYEYGWELVDEDWKLEFPVESQTKLKEMETQAVAESRQQLQWLAQVSPELFNRKANKTQYRVASGGGGIVRDGGPSIDNDPNADDPLGGFGRIKSGGGSAIPGFADGTGNSVNGAGGTNGRFAGSAGNLNGGFGGGSGNGVNGQPGMVGGLADNSAFGTGAPGGRGLGQSGLGSGGVGPGGLNSGPAGGGGLNSGGLGGTGVGGPGNNSANGGGANGGVANGGPDVANVGPRYAGTGNGTGGFGNGTQNFGSGNSNLGSGTAGQGSGNTALAAGAANTANGPTNTANGTSNTANGIRGMSGSGSPSEYGGVQLPGSAEGMMNTSGSPGSATGSSGGQYTASSGQYSPSNTTGGGSPYGSSTSAAGAAGGSGASSSAGGNSSSSTSSGGGVTALGSPGGDPNATSGTPTLSFDMSPQQQQSAASLDDSTQQQQSSSSHNMARNRGKNWALPTSRSASMPIDRPIRVECWSDRLVLVPDTRDQQVQVIPLGQRTEDAVDQLVGAVRTYTKSWGIAGRSMYWRPQLVLNVNPNAEARAADLQTLLADSGWDVKRK